MKDWIGCEVLIKWRCSEVYIDKYLPFLDRAPLLGREVSTINVDELFFPLEVKDLNTEKFDNVEEEMMNSKPKVLHVKPLYLYVMDAPIDEVAWYIQHGGELVVVDTDVDYHKVARFIEVDEVRNSNYAFYPTSNSYEGIEVETGKYINYARNRIDMRDEESINENRSAAIVNETRKEIIEAGKSIMELTEATLDDPNAFFDDEVQRRENGDDADETSRVEGGLNKIEAMLDSYLSGGYVTERVPLLAGPTAVLKSATVKEIAANHGYRMVDFRAAFMSRLDLEGLMERVEVDGKVEAFNAGMYNIIECTDNFLDFCETAIDKINGKIDELKDLPDDNQAEVAELEDMLDYYEEKSKPAVLFFDEVTRASTPILNALTTILNQKEFLGYPMTRSRIIAATNLPTDLPQEYRQLYSDTEIDDAATADRFQTIVVNPEDVEDKWMNWANSSDGENQNIHPIIMEVLEESPSQKYSFEDVMSEFDRTNDRSRLYTTAFPNYRTWDMLTNYLNKREEMNEPLSRNAIKGLVGDTAANLVIEKLQNEGYEIEESTAQGEMDDAVEQGMATGTPTMLLGPSSIGKTTRVKNIAEKYGVKKENFIKINLAQQDAIDIMGPPTKVDLAAYVGGHGQGNKDSIFGDSSEIGRELQDLVKKSALPEKCTIKAPKTNLASVIRDAMENRERVVIFFDEFNRVQDDSVMTAVFEAVSDNRIFGVDFDPELVQIFTAANIGRNYDGAADFDPAFAARFNIYRKDGYDVHDVRNFKEWMENNNYNKFIQEYVDNKSEEEVLEMISRIETRGLQDSVPSLRAFTDLNKVLNDDSKASKKFRGATLFSNDKADKLYTDVVTTPMNKLADNASQMKEMAEELKDRVRNWAAKDTNFTVNFRDRELDAEDLEMLLNNAYDRLFISNPNTNFEDKQAELSMMRTLIQKMFALDKSVVNQREGVIEGILGEEGAEDFLGYYNMVSGTDEVNVEIEDLRDETLIEPFFTQKISSISNIDDKINSAVAYYQDFYDEFGDSLSQAHYQKFILESVGIMPSIDSANNLLSKVTQVEDMDKILQNAEKEDDDFIQQVMNKIGVPVKDEDIENAKQSEYEGPTPKMLGGDE